MSEDVRPVLAVVLFMTVILNVLTIKGTTYATQLAYAVIFFVGGIVVLQGRSPESHEAVGGWMLVSIGIGWVLYAYRDKVKLLDKRTKIKKDSNNE